MLGDYHQGDVLDLLFTTRHGGVPTSLLGAPAVSVYNGNSLAQSTAGITLDVDWDGIVGLNHLRIDTSADGSFYADASSFIAILTAGTVGGVTVVGVVIEDFTIGKQTSNVTKVNDTVLTGNGTVATPWGPV